MLEPTEITIDMTEADSDSFLPYEWQGNQSWKERTDLFSPKEIEQLVRCGVETSSPRGQKFIRVREIQLERLGSISLEEKWQKLKSKDVIKFLRVEGLFLIGWEPEISDED